MVGSGIFLYTCNCAHSRTRTIRSIVFNYLCHFYFLTASPYPFIFPPVGLADRNRICDLAESVNQIGDVILYIH